MQHLVIFPSQPNGYPLGDVSIAERLRDIGYKTAMVGKWHLGFFKSEYTPTYRGFDTYYGKVLVNVLLIPTVIFETGKALTFVTFFVFAFRPVKPVPDGFICQECTMEQGTISLTR